MTSKIFPSMGGKSFGGLGGRSGSGTGVSRTARQPSDRTLKTCLMIFANPTAGGGVNGDWGVSSAVTMTPVVKGANWEVWKNAVSGMAGSSSSEIVESVVNNYQYVAFNGTTGRNFAACADVTFFGHAPPLGYIQDCVDRSRGRMQPGLFFANFESVSQELSFNPWWLTLDTVQLGRLRDTGVAQSGATAIPGCTRADLAEETVSPTQVAVCGTQEASKAPHTWICDMAAATAVVYVDTWFATLTNMILARYGKGVIKYVMVDNVLPNHNWGTASNPDAAITPTIYSNTWKTFWTRAAAFELATGAKMVGNCALSSATYTNAQVPARYGEHFFHFEQNSQNTSSEILTTIRSNLRAAAGQTLVLPNHQIKSIGTTYTARSYGSTHVDNWSGTDGGPGGFFGTWSDVRDAAWTTGQHETLMVVAGRTHSTFPLFFHSTFRRPEG